MTKPRLTGVGGGNAFASASLSWEYVASNKDLARRVVIYLEDRRVLTEARTREDFEECRLSANDIRHWLTLEIMNVKSGGHLEGVLKRMRSASTSFVSAAGKDSESFKRDHSHFQACLQAYRDAVGREIGELAVHYRVDVGVELAAIIPPPDPRPFV
ncbi:hypothetical protein [Kineococcus glutinatus]|uniref:Uncharacterized protein n=1 Tax=Kineococcus glutinatus TaxID=1070872 RepID=A0ABP9H2Y1_9ACTN